MLFNKILMEEDFQNEIGNVLGTFRYLKMKFSVLFFYPVSYKNSTKTNISKPAANSRKTVFSFGKRATSVSFFY